MSGKAPPRGPRALLSSLPASSSASQASTSSASTSTPPAAGTSSKFGTAPPTGPRSLVNGIPTHPRSMPTTKALVNGHPPSSSTGSDAFNAPIAPRSSQKSTQGESALSNSSSHLSSADSPAHDPISSPTTSSSVPATVADGVRPHQPVKFSFPTTRRTSLTESRPQPPQPTSEPPPPPPPPGPPPAPPPPPQSPPPPPPPAAPSLDSPQPRPPTSSPPSAPPELPCLDRPTSPQPPPLPSASSTSLTPQSPDPTSLPSEVTQLVASTPKSQPPQLYSLSPPPLWPPSRSEYPPGRNFRIIFDPITDKDRDGRMRSLLEKIRAAQKDGSELRITGKGKGKETITRYDGEVIEGELEPIPKDPRKVPGFKRRYGREAFHEIKYEYDQNSTGPSPPTAVLVTSISPLTPTQHIRRAFSTYGRICSFEPQIDMETGMALGIVLIRYQNHDEAKQCVERAHGKKLSVVVGTSEGEDLQVVFDGEGLKLKAVLKELDERKKREREERRRKERESKIPPPPTSTATPSSTHTPTQAPHSNWRTNHQLPPRPAHIPLTNGRSSPSAHTHPRSKKPPPLVFTKARMNNSLTNRFTSLHDLVPSSTYSSASTPVHPRRPSDHSRHVQSRSPSPRSRSPSPIARRHGYPSARVHPYKGSTSSSVIEVLAKNGYEHVRLDLSGGAMGSVQEDDVRAFFQDFKVDCVLRDHGAWYVAFKTADSARRATMVLNSGGRTLAHHSVHVTMYPPPSQVSSLPSGKTSWTEEEMVQCAEQAILHELMGLLEKDITERVVAVGLRKLVTEEKARAADAKMKEGVDGVAGPKPAEKRGLKGLSFRKPGKRTREEGTKPVVAVVKEVQPENADLHPVAPPKKRRKQEAFQEEEVVGAEVESEDEQSVVTEERKRVLSEDIMEEEQPVKKKVKKDTTVEGEVPSKKSALKKKAPKRKTTKDVVEQVFLSETLEYARPATVTIDVSRLESLSRSLSPVPEAPSPKRPPDPRQVGIFEDDEDLYFTRLALSGETEQLMPSPPSDSVPPFRKHVTGSARTEGYYKISHAEKSAYVAQYALRSSTVESFAAAEPPAQQVTSSRSNRANARRRAQGLEEINQVQRAVALSKGETAAAELSIKFNQLQTRKKHLRFARSPIHDWGLYAMERISRGEMVIEYVGEIIRAQVADKREKVYERQGIGSSYLFRIDEDLVVDATKKGNLGRLINHSCDPNCTAKIITINGEKKIVIYAKQDIELGDEITYDYHFPIEQDKIPCLCGSAKCRGYLN